MNTLGTFAPKLVVQTVCFKKAVVARMVIVGFHHVYQEPTITLAGTMNLGFDKTNSIVDDRRNRCDVILL